MKLWIIDLDDTAAYTTRDMQGDHGRFAELTPAPGILEFLIECQAKGDRYALVTVGEWALQMRKLEHLKLPFAYIRITPDTGLPTAKLDVFESIKRRNGDVELVVVGDRLDRDIAVGKSLGFTTVRMRLPRGRYSDFESQTPEETPDYTVKDFFELMQLPIFTDQ
jgi:putative hydrolase of the HAD superfamily